MTKKTTRKTATFRIDREVWEQFRNLAEREGTNASEVITRFIAVCLSEERVPSEGSFTPPSSIHALEERMDALERKIEGWPDEGDWE